MRRFLCFVILVWMSAVPVMAEPVVTFDEAEAALESCRGAKGISQSDPQVLKLLAQVFRGAATGAETSPRAWVDLGRVLTLQGRFAEAVAAFEKAPGGDDLGVARGRLAVATALRGQLSGILRIEPLPGTRWIVLSGREAAPVGPFGSCRDLRVHGVEGGRIVWQDAVRDPRFPRDPVNFVNLYVIPEAVPHVVVSTITVGASWSPSSVVVYRGWPLTSVLRVVSDDPLALQQVGGHWLVSNDHAIGATLSHAEQPRWTDFYTFVAARGRYEIANRLEADAFPPIVALIDERLAAHPDDWQLLYYRARGLEIAGRRADALAAYEKALHVARRLLGGGRDVDAWTRGELGPAVVDMERRVKGLGRP